MTTDNMPPHPYGMNDWAKDHPEPTPKSDNMPPLPDYPFDAEDIAILHAYARSYAEQQTAELTGLRVELEQAVAVAHSRLFQIESLKQQTEKLIAEKAILEKASSDNFALYYEAKRDRKELREQVEELKAKIHCQDTYILELLTKLKDKQ